MLNASQIKNLIPEGGSLTLSFTATKDGRISVLLKPQYPAKSPTLTGSAKEAVEAVTAPRLITGTPEELDASFMDFIGKTVEKANSLNTAIEEIEKATNEAVAKVKAEGDKKVKTAKKEAAAKVKKTNEAVAKGGSATQPETTAASSRPDEKSVSSQEQRAESDHPETSQSVQSAEKAKEDGKQGSLI